MTRLRWLPAVLAAVLFWVTGCGVGATGGPVKEGDAAAGGASASRTSPRTADDAGTAEELITYFLQAAAGGLADANTRVRAFLTADALTQWQDPPEVENQPLTLVRVVGEPRLGAPVGRRTPVDLTYQTVGTLTDAGRVDDLVSPANQTLRFWVVENENSLPRIDQIDGWPVGQLLLSDAGLKQYYQIQPVYFWDTNYQLLVPDLRYVPLTINPDQRASRLLQWLVLGPSPWLAGVRRLPASTTYEPVVSDRDGTLRVNLSAEAAGNGDPETLRRLMYQLQWTFALLNGSDSSSPRIDLHIDQQSVSTGVGLDDFRAFNHSSTYANPNADPYEISQGTIVPPAGVPVSVLSAPENSGVLSAAVSQSDGVAVLVRGDSTSRWVQVLRSTVTGVIDTQVPTSGTLGARPSLVPSGPPTAGGAVAGSDVALVPAGGRLLAVSTIDGTTTDAAPGLTGVTAAAVSPDGRRVAVVADGRVVVASLIVNATSGATAVNAQVSVGTTQRQLLAGKVTARAVTWLSESWLLVGGTSSNGSTALWRVTADGTVAEDTTGSTRGLQIIDLVCYPLWSARSQVDVLAITDQGVYSVRATVPDPRPGLDNPFFAS